MRKSILDYDVIDWEVYCNGVQLPFCYAADDTEGWADCYVLEKEQLVVREDPQSGEKSLTTKRVYGRIEFQKKHI